MSEHPISLVVARLPLDAEYAMFSCCREGPEIIHFKLLDPLARLVSDIGFYRSSGKRQAFHTVTR